MCFRYIAFWGGRNHIVFLGDSRIRQLYFEYVQALSTNQYNKHEHHQGNASEAIHHDLEHHDNNLNLKIQFLWRPMVNRSFVEEFRTWSTLEHKSRPSMIITGSATHSIKMFNASHEALDYYRKNLTILLPLMDQLNGTTTILWALQDPVKPDLLRADRAMITNEQIDAYNRVAREILRFTKTNAVQVWSSARLVAQGYGDAIMDNTNNDGLHANTNALKFVVQMLFNLYCNDHMNYNDGTCCSDPERLTGIQTFVLLALAAVVVIRVALLVVTKLSVHHKPSGHRLRAFHKYRWTRLHNRVEEMELIEDDNDGEEQLAKVTKQEGSTSSKFYRKDILVLVTRLALVMFYFVLCDRTNFFMKENKYFTRPNFYLPIAYVFVLGLFFTDEASAHTANVLHRDQTYEMRGAMQLLILGKFTIVYKLT